MEKTGMTHCFCCGNALAHPGWGPPALAHCQSCGSAYLPALEGVEAYEADYFNGRGKGGVDYLGSKPQFQLINRGRMAFIQTWTGPGAGRRFLDLGCALGFFMEVAEEAGWEAWGVEVSDYAAAQAESRFGRRAFHGTLDQAPSDWRGMALATAFHVLEHVPDPKAVLQDLAARMDEGSFLALEVPDYGSSTAQREKAGWKYFLPGEHLNYFTQAGLRSLLQGAGFEVLGVKATSFTRLLGPLDQAGLTGLKQLLLRFLPWLRWVKGAVLALRGLAGGHDCVLIVARKRAA